MARKGRQHASFSVENLFFEDYCFGSLMTDVFLADSELPHVYQCPKNKKVHGTFGLG